MLDLKRPHPPTDDKRWKMVDRTMRRYGYEPHALIETLHSVQDAFGYLEKEALGYVALSLKVPLSQVYGVATFYHFFNLKPRGKHTCVVCTGTACYIKGVPELMQAIADKAGVADGQTTQDNQLSVLSARCVGACGLAPVVVLDGEVVGNLDYQSMADRIQNVLDD